MKRIYIFLLMTLAGCTGALIPHSPQQIVVEGWIEDGKAPVVMVTTTVPVSTEKQELSSLEKNVVRWATVSVSDGEKEVFLTGRRNDDYFPPYIYTTAMLTGQPGKKYRLNVKYSGMRVMSETTIPQSHHLEYLRAEKSGDDNYVLVAGLEDREQSKDYYKFFVRVDGRDSIYISSFLGLVDEAILSEGVNDIQIFNTFKPSSLDVENEAEMYFKKGDKVGVRLCNMDQRVYEYWEDFDDVSSLSLNPFFPVMKKIRSNISGGLGYWAGYGSSYYYIECK